LCLIVSYSYFKHGRKKEKRTAEEDAKKKKDQAKKMAAYQHAMKMILENVSSFKIRMMSMFCMFCVCLFN